MHARLLNGVAALAVAGIAMTTTQAAAGPETAIAAMKGPDGSDMGTVTLTQYPQGVLLSADLAGLAQGGHGFHIHQTGLCAPDFAAAGDHFNPMNAGHGYSHEGEPHAGDMPNIFADAQGKARADALNTRVTLQQGQPGSLLDDDGSAIIVHEKPDSYGDDAGAGGRVACGVIEAR